MHISDKMYINYLNNSVFTELVKNVVSVKYNIQIMLIKVKLHESDIVLDRALKHDGTTGWTTRAGDGNMLVGNLSYYM